MKRKARSKQIKPRPFQLQVEGFSARRAVVFADLPDARRLTVKILAPGTFVSPAVSVEIQCDGGPAGYTNGREADRQRIDIWGDDLEALVATLTEAIRDGAATKASPESGVTSISRAARSS